MGKLSNEEIDRILYEEEAKQQPKYWLPFLTTAEVTNVFGVIGLLILFGGVYLGGEIYDSPAPESFSILLLLCSLEIGFLGVIYIQRKEGISPKGRRMFKGRFAVYYGFIWIVFWWGMALWAAVDILLALLAKR